MTRRWRATAVTVALAGLVSLGSGCQVAQDDEMAPPARRTITASPAPATTSVPSMVPVGHGRIAPDDVVWAQGNVLHVGRRGFDLSPVGIEALVAVDGGVFVLSDGELWFTDLSRLRGTGITGMTRVAATQDGGRLLVTRRLDGGGEQTYAYDTRTGKAVPATGLPAARDQDRLGAPVTEGLPGTGLREGRQGPGGYGVAVTAAGVPVGFRAGSDQPLRLGGAVPRHFEVDGWAGAATVYGVGGATAADRAVVSCDLAARRCSRLGRIDGSEPVVFGSGA